MTADEFEHFDAAYALGSLSTDDRRRFEEHLLGCDCCLQRVAHLWPLPGLLALAPEWAFAAGTAAGSAAGSRAAPGEPTEEDGPDPEVAPGDAPVPELLPDLLRRVRAHRRRRRVVALSAAAAVVACAVSLVVALLPGRSPGPDQAPAAARRLTNVLPIDMVSSIEVVRHESGDQVNLWCTYRSAKLPPEPGNYLAVARDRSGRSEVVGSWPVIPGRTAVLRTPTTFPAGRIASVEVTSASGRVLARITL